MKVNLSIEEANTLLGYLAKQPYGEVAGLIQMISSKAQPERKDAKEAKNKTTQY